MLTIACGIVLGYLFLALLPVIIPLALIIGFFILIIGILTFIGIWIHSFAGGFGVFVYCLSIFGTIIFSSEQDKIPTKENNTNGEKTDGEH